MSLLFGLPNELLAIICDYLIPDAESSRTASSSASAHAAQRDLINVYKTCRGLRSITQGSLDRRLCVDIDLAAKRSSTSQRFMLKKYRAAPLMARKVTFLSISIDAKKAPVRENSGARSTRCMTELKGFQPIPEQILDSLLGLFPNVTYLVWHEKITTDSREAKNRSKLFFERIAHMKNLEALELSLVRDVPGDSFPTVRVPTQLSPGSISLPRLHTLRISPSLLVWAVRNHELSNLQHLLLDGAAHSDIVNKMLVYLGLRHMKTFTWTLTYWSGTAVRFRFFPLVYKEGMVRMESLKIQAASSEPAVRFYPCGVPLANFRGMLWHFRDLKVLELPLHLILSQDDNDPQKFRITSLFPSSLKTLKLGIYQGGYTEDVDQARLAYLLAECLVPRTSVLPYGTIEEHQLEECRRSNELQAYWKSELNVVVNNTECIAIPLEHLQNVDVLYPSCYDDLAMREPFVVAGLKGDVPIVSKRIGLS